MQDFINYNYLSRLPVCHQEQQTVKKQYFSEGIEDLME